MVRRQSVDRVGVTAESHLHTWPEEKSTDLLVWTRRQLVIGQRHLDRKVDIARIGLGCRETPVEELSADRVETISQERLSMVMPATIDDLQPRTSSIHKAVFELKPARCEVPLNKSSSRRKQREG